jgi:hypothetical protein
MGKNHDEPSWEEENLFGARVCATSSFLIGQRFRKRRGREGGRERDTQGTKYKAKGRREQYRRGEVRGEMSGVLTTKPDFSPKMPDFSPIFILCFKV